MLDNLSLDRSLQWTDGRQLNEMIFSTSSACAIAATASKLLSPMTEQHPSQVTTSRDANT